MVGPVVVMAGSFSGSPRPLMNENGTSVARLRALRRNKKNMRRPSTARPPRTPPMIPPFIDGLPFTLKRVSVDNSTTRGRDEHTQKQ